MKGEGQDIGTCQGQEAEGAHSLLEPAAFH